MTKRIALHLLAALWLSACTAPLDAPMEPATAKASAGQLRAPVAVDTMALPAPAQNAPSPEICDGDGIGGTGCPDL